MENEKSETMDEKCTYDLLDNQINEQIKELSNMGIQAGNIEYFYKLLKSKERVNEMRYRDYNDYGRYNDRYGARRRDSRGRYMGEEHFGEMREHYGNYRDSRERYGANNETMKSLEYMLESLVDFVEMLERDADSQEEMELIRKYTRKLSDM